MEKGDADQLGRIFGALRQIGPEQIIVDLPRRKADSIRILARYPDGSLKVPEFSFNPVKWADAYDLQKRTGYVFAPREVLPIVALAAKVVFLTEFGVVMNGNADGSIKAGQTIGAKWIDQLADQGVIDQDVVTQLQTKQESLLSLQRNDLAIPKKMGVRKPRPTVYTTQWSKKVPQRRVDLYNSAGVSQNHGSDVCFHGYVV